jgi:hypothetical protein
MQPPFKYCFFHAGASFIDAPFWLFADKINQDFALSSRAAESG